MVRHTRAYAKIAASSHMQIFCNFLQQHKKNTDALQCLYWSHCSPSVFCPAVISQEEFIEGALEDEWIREMLECDLHTVKVERALKAPPGP